MNLLIRNAVVCLEEALCVLTKAAELNPSMLGTWRYYLYHQNKTFIDL